MKKDIFPEEDKTLINLVPNNKTANHRKQRPQATRPRSLFECPSSSALGSRVRGSGWPGGSWAMLWLCSLHRDTCPTSPGVWKGLREHGQGASLPAPAPTSGWMTTAASPDLPDVQQLSTSLIYKIPSLGFPRGGPWSCDNEHFPPFLPHFPTLPADRLPARSKLPTTLSSAVALCTAWGNGFRATDPTCAGMGWPPGGRVALWLSGSLSPWVSHPGWFEPTCWLVPRSSLGWPTPLGPAEPSLLSPGERPPHPSLGPFQGTPCLEPGLVKLSQLSEGKSCKSLTVVLSVLAFLLGRAACLHRSSAVRICHSLALWPPRTFVTPQSLSVSVCRMGTILLLWGRRKWWNAGGTGPW